MNQFVAPTSFITETSRRRAKIAMRIVFKMSTPAETMSTRAMIRSTSCRMSTVVWISWIVATGAIAAKTPEYWPNVDTTTVARPGWTGVQRIEDGVVEGFRMNHSWTGRRVLASM